jgi:dipeptidyl aminopeptidase/acylaminoacyl peptidase
MNVQDDIMTHRTTAVFGSWKSPVSPDIVASGGIRLEHPVVIDSSGIYWLETRPVEGGRSVLVRLAHDGTIGDVTPPPYSVRTRVHEYGGGAYLVDNGTVYFSNLTDQRLYRQDPGSEPRPITPEADFRYADGVMDRRRKRVICVREDHTVGGHEPVNSLVAVDTDGRDPIKVMISGNDFYASPRLNPDATRMVWLTWNHPRMPWDGSELWMVDITGDGSITDPVKIAGGRDESVSQPRFSPDGTLYFISDRSGWWNPYRWNNGNAVCLWATEAEFAAPDWVFGLSSYAFITSERILCSYTRNGTSHLCLIDTINGQNTPVATPYTSIDTVTMGDGYAVFLAASPTEARSVVRLDLPTGESKKLRASTDLSIDEGYLSIPEAIEFPTENGLHARAFYYAPKNRDFTAPAGERPPLLVTGHGGPTGQASGALNYAVQYWTSRGFAVVDVDYGGSSGYGRAYRQRLAGKWGITDVDDCANAARYLTERGPVDKERIAIRGGSAGGFTALAALAFRDIFRAGASYYGVSDLEALVKDTHKFESCYLDGLIGPYPERRDIYQERSPIHHVDGLSCPVIFFQGSDDKIVLPNQAETMVDALRRKGVPVSYLIFRGEMHGFRKSENIRRALEAELYFYSRIFGFEPAEPIEPVKIENTGTT